MSSDLSNIFNGKVIELKPNPELIIAKSGKMYYKSLYTSIKKYNDKNREKVNEVSRNRYRNDPQYKEKNKENNRIRYYRLKNSIENTEN